ncbi:MAG: hypothetical protein AB8C46_02085 [Burkholderiaceae bacterium]
MEGDRMATVLQRAPFDLVHYDAPQHSEFQVNFKPVAGIRVAAL